MPWEVARLISSSLKEGAGGACVEDLKSWHKACRLARDAARGCASTLLISAHGKWASLAQPLQLFCHVQKLEVTVKLGSLSVLDFNSLSPCKSETLAEIPTKILRVQEDGGPSSFTDAARSTLQRCAALHNLVVFNSLHVDVNGASGAAAVCTLSKALAGNLRKLGCPAEATVPDGDWYSGMTRLEEVVIGDCTAPCLRAAGQLPRLRKMTCMVRSEEAWLQLCQLTQLQDLRAYVMGRPREDYSELYRLSGLTHLRLFVHFATVLGPLDFWCGLLPNMPHLEVLSLHCAGLKGYQIGLLPSGFCHGRLRRLFLRLQEYKGMSADDILDKRSWCPNLEEFTLDDNVVWHKNQNKAD